MENIQLKNNLETKIKELEKKGFRFKPGRNFFIEIGIGQKRWGQLMRNEKPITTEELQNVSSLFGIPVGQLIEQPTNIFIKK